MVKFSTATTFTKSTPSKPQVTILDRNIKRKANENRIK